MNLRNMPKIELHLHLDGSLDIYEVKAKYNLTDEEAKKYMVADEKCKNLNDYLTKFDYPISIMQTKEELTFATVSLLKRLKSQNVIYAEIRFAPQLHTRGGLTQDEVVKTVLDAMKTVDIKAKLILCLMRGDDLKDNYMTIEMAFKYLKEGVCAIDLAGAEALYKTSDYEPFFELANEKDIPFTIHAGEADGVESIKSAIKFGAKRIGHGVRAIEDEELVQYIVDNNITLEVCPTSNIQTCICEDYASHPLFELYKKNVRVTINTDNMTVSNTFLAKEYSKLIQTGKITINDIIKMNLNSINASFLSKEEKKELREKFLGEIKGENK